MELANFPVRICEGLGLVCNNVGTVAGAYKNQVLLASWPILGNKRRVQTMQGGKRALTTRTVPNSIHQVAAEINVEDNRVIPKVIPNIAVCARKVGRGLAPSARIRLLARNVRGNGAASKLPHADTRITPLHGHDAASILVVIRAKGAVCSLDAAACVAVLGGITIGLKGFVRLLPLYAHGAAAGGVKRHLISVGGLVRCLHDIDLAVLGPVGWVSEPESGPGAAAKRSVTDVKDE